MFLSQCMQALHSHRRHTFSAARKGFFFSMSGFDNKSLLRAIDEELDRLRKVRDLLTSDGDLHSRPAKRNLSAEARQRIVDAQKRRWAARKPHA